MQYAHPMKEFTLWAMTPPQLATFKAFERTLCAPVLDGEEPDGFTSALSREGYNCYLGVVVEAFATLSLSGSIRFGSIFAEGPAGAAAPDCADYCRQLQKAPFRLYQIISVSKGEGAVFRDLKTGGETFVHDVAASRWLEPGICMAARIVDWNGRQEMSGGFLPFSKEDGETTLREHLKYESEIAAQGGLSHPMDTLFASNEVLYLMSWLAIQFDALRRMQTRKRRAPARRGVRVMR
jgi:hypothetical protein